MDKLTFSLIVGTLIRSGLMFMAGRLSEKGILPESMVDDWVAAVLLVVITLLWSFWQKLSSKWHLDAALAAPAGMTLKEAITLAADKAQRDDTR